MVSIAITTMYGGLVGIQASSRSKTLGLNSSCSKLFCAFRGLKAVSNVEVDSFFLGKASNASLQASLLTKLEEKQVFSNHRQPQASYKVAILRASSGIGQPLGLLIKMSPVKMSPVVSALHLYDITNVKGVAADLSHYNTPTQVLDFTGPSELANCLKGADVVVIPTGIPRKPGMTLDDLFDINTGIVKTLVEAVADNCPDAFIHIISSPLNSTVPIAVEVLKQQGVYNPKKLFGVTTLDVVRANTLVTQKKQLKLIDVDVSVIRGHTGITILPLLSKTRLVVPFRDEEVEELTVRIQNARIEVVQEKKMALDLHPFQWPMLLLDLLNLLSEHLTVMGMSTSAPSFSLS